MQVTEDFDREGAWVVGVLAGLAVLVAGSVAFPRSVYDGFVWHYFWGPVYADAHNAACAVNTAGGVELLYQQTACTTADAGAIVAEPGYTLVSEVGYMIVLLVMLVGVYFLLRRLDLADDLDLFFALVPFMLFGGALRVVEDATDTVPAGVAPLLSYPENTLFISPIIYVTVFLITLAALLLGVALQRKGVVEEYHRAVAAMGTAALVVTIGYLTSRALTTDYVGFYPQILLVVVAVATALSVGIYYGIDQYRPELNAGTGLIGLVMIWGHAIDGVANVVAADWIYALGLPRTIEYGAKHPANAVIIAISEGILPPSIQNVIGTSWPFLVVKLAVAVGIVWLFDEQFLDDSPRYALILLVAAVAVGLGPGSRDMLRVAFGI